MFFFLYNLWFNMCYRYSDDDDDIISRPYILLLEQNMFVFKITNNKLYSDVEICWKYIGVDKHSPQV